MYSLETMSSERDIVDDEYAIQQERIFGFWIPVCSLGGSRIIYVVVLGM